jgi:hypothetical protein
MKLRPIFLDITLDSGKPVSNAWVTYLREGHSFAKAEVISYTVPQLRLRDKRRPLLVSCHLKRGPRPIR